MKKLALTKVAEDKWICKSNAAIVVKRCENWLSPSTYVLYLDGEREGEFDKLQHVRTFFNEWFANDDE